MQTELVDVSSGTQLWGDQYKGKLDDILGLQEEIAQQVSQKLRLRLSGAEKTEISKHTTQNSEAYQLNLKGRYFWNKRTQEGLLKAIEYLNQASDRDPGYALAYAGLADSYLVQGVDWSASAKGDLSQSAGSGHKGSEHQQSPSGCL